MHSVLKTAPTGMLISLGEAKSHLRVDHTASDGYVQALILMAIAQAETITRRRLLTQTWTAYFDGWPKGKYIQLPYGRLQSVASVKYLDSDGTEYTMDSGDYIVDTDSEPGRVVLGYGETWPSETLYPSNPVYIEFTCGYGAHALQTITNATNAAPIVVTSATHGLTTGDQVLISSVGGNTNANGTWNITRTSGDAFSLDGSSGNAAYTTGGILVKLEVPAPIRTAILLLIEDYYDNRGGVVVGASVGSIPGHVMDLLWPYRLWMG